MCWPGTHPDREDAFKGHQVHQKMPEPNSERPPPVKDGAFQPGVMVHTYDPSAWEAKAETSLQGQLESSAEFEVSLNSKSQK